MFQNIKTDIIYYKTNTDFEMEFNLCGCCRMRLLTDKANDRRLLISNLSRAVSRSRIIIVVGPLFSEDNIIGTIAEAIGKKLTNADNRTYGINSSEEIKIISGSTPLVTGDGIFGGCIIESGPQSMILLSDSKNIRKSIMNNLIHPYIEDIYAGELKANSNEEQTLKAETDENHQAEQTESESVPEIAAEGIIEEPLKSESAEPAEADRLINSESEESADMGQASQIPLILDEDEIKLSGTMTYDTDDSHIQAENDEQELFTESKKIRRKEAKYYNEAYGDFLLDDTGLIGEEDFRRANYSGPKFTRIATIVVSIIILLILVVLCYCMFYVPSKDGVSASSYIRDIYNTLFS